MCMDDVASYRTLARGRMGSARERPEGAWVPRGEQAEAVPERREWRPRVRRTTSSRGRLSRPGWKISGDCEE